MMKTCASLFLIAICSDIILWKFELDIFKNALENRIWSFKKVLGRQKKFFFEKIDLYLIFFVFHQGIQISWNFWEILINKGVRAKKPVKIAKIPVLTKFRRFFGFNSFIYQYFSKISTDLNSLLKTEENEV